MPRLKKKLFEDEAVEEKPTSKRKQQPSTPKNKRTKKKNPATPRKKLTTPVKVKEENPRVQLKSCPKTELFKVIEATDINYYLHNSEDIFILKQTEIKSLILNDKDVIRISNSIVKETNGVKEIILPAMSSVSQINETIDVPFPEEKVLSGTVGFKSDNKIFINTRKGIVMITNKQEDFNPIRTHSYQFYFIEENKYKGKFTTQHSFYRDIADVEFSLDNQDFVVKNIKSKEVDSYHYIEGSLIECAYLKNESIYNEDKTLWGVFKVLDKNSNKILDVSMVHEAFNFFKIDFEAVEKGDFKRLRELIDKYFSERENRTTVRFLVKVTMRKATADKQVVVYGIQKLL